MAAGGCRWRKGSRPVLRCALRRLLSALPPAPVLEPVPRGAPRRVTETLRVSSALQRVVGSSSVRLSSGASAHATRKDSGARRKRFDHSKCCAGPACREPRPGRCWPLPGSKQAAERPCPWCHTDNSSSSGSSSRAPCQGPRRAADVVPLNAGTPAAPDLFRTRAHEGPRRLPIRSRRAAALIGGCSTVAEPDRAA